MKVDIKHFNELTIVEWHNLLQLRINVFVVEQDCPYEELDGKDLDAFHLIMIEDEKTVGTARILKPGVSYNEVSIGRVVIDPAYREKRWGHDLMTSCMHFIDQTLGKTLVRISAQEHLKKYYEKHGFEVVSKPYLEDNMPHVQMLFTPVL